MVRRYIKPSWFFARVFNPVVLATGVLNSEPMTVIKRRSKLPQTIPMTPVELDGVKYVVSVRGETEWVKNVRANPHIKLPNSGATDYIATEVPTEARKRILEAYKATASKATHRLFRQLPEGADHPVFALTPLAQPSGKMSRPADGNGRLPPNGLWGLLFS
jgi:F420H(2)-dependent quinone reductase